MKSTVCDTLRMIANSREHAYKAAGRVSMAKMRAVGRIRNVAGYFSTQPEEKQFRAVLSVEQELHAITPHELSRYTRLREKIIHLIHTAHAHERSREAIS